MRVKVCCSILGKHDNAEGNYSHDIYCLIINHMPSNIAKEYKKKIKCFRLFTYAGPYICEKPEQETIHFYVAGEDSIISEFVANITSKKILKINNIVAKVVSVNEEMPLEPKETYFFKTNVIINKPMDGGPVLLDDFNLFEERLQANALRKAECLGLSGDIKFSIIAPKRKTTPYRDGHIFSWRCILKVNGSYDVVNAIYQCGVGENTATGHGFLWEIR